MSDRPTPASDRPEPREKMRDAITRAAMKNMTIPQSRIFAYEVEIFTDEFVGQLVAAAVQAESRKLLERLKQGLPMQQECDYHGGGEEGCPGCSASDEHNNTLKTVTALLDSEQQKLGGES